jgi:outer membrane protein
MSGIYASLITFGFCFFYLASQSQDSLRNNPLTIAEACKLALDNSIQLKIAGTQTLLAKEETQVQRLSQLPGISSSLDYGYLSNADVWNPSLSHHFVAGLPHPLTLFTVTATETIFAGSRVNNTIRLAGLEEQIAFLQQEKDETDIKFLVIAQYLDIYRLLNQDRVYIDNTNLAKQRLRNILSLRRQGMVTLNDQLRTELTISDYELATRRIANAVVELNNQLNSILGLPDTSRLLPDTTLLQQSLGHKTLNEFIDDAFRENYELKVTAREKDVAETRIKLLRGERLPEVGLFAQSNLQRPFLNAIPSIDVYYNVWRAGVSVSYDISSIYRSPRKIKEGLIGLDLARQQDSLQRQNLQVEVKNAFIKYNESQDEFDTYKRDLQSALENYRSVEKRYFNQLALLTDLIDATNTRTEAEIRLVNSEIGVVYNYYQLMRTIGTL